MFQSRHCGDVVASNYVSAATGRPTMWRPATMAVLQRNNYDDCYDMSFVMMVDAKVTDTTLQFATLQFTMLHYKSFTSLNPLLNA
jgi:hypothetical protein